MHLPRLRTDLPAGSSSAPSYSGWLYIRVAFILTTLALIAKPVLLLVMAAQMGGAEKGVIGGGVGPGGVFGQIVVDGVYYYAIVLFFLLPLAITTTTFTFLNPKSKYFIHLLHAYNTCLVLSLLTTIGLAIRSFCLSNQSADLADAAWHGGLWSDTVKAGFQNAFKCCGFENGSEARVPVGACAGPAATAISGCKVAAMTIFREAEDKVFSSLFASCVAEFLAIFACACGIGVYRKKTGAGIASPISASTPRNQGDMFKSSLPTDSPRQYAKDGPAPPMPSHRSYGPRTPASQQAAQQFAERYGQQNRYITPFTPHPNSPSPTPPPLSSTLGRTTPTPPTRTDTLLLRSDSEASTAKRAFWTGPSLQVAIPGHRLDVINGKGHGPAAGETLSRGIRDSVGWSKPWPSPAR